MSVRNPWSVHAGLLLPLSAVAGTLLSGACFNPEDPSAGTEAGSSEDTGAGSESSTLSTTSMATTSEGPTTSETSGESTTTNEATTSEPESTTTSDEDTGKDTMVDACGDSEVCVPAIPEAWDGPMVLGGDTCPTEFPRSLGPLFADLQPGEHTCACNCGVESVECGLYLENEGLPFSPIMSCQSPPTEDECVSAVVSATCLETTVDVPATPSWGQEAERCSGATAGASCEGDGACLPGGAPICIAQAGEHECPEGFADAQLFYSGYDDARSCTDCSCTPQGQACSADIEVCSIGFYEVTLTSGGSCEQLNSGDGDGVSLLGTNISNSGSCVAGAGTGEVQGDISETGAITVCCMG